MPHGEVDASSGLVDLHVTRASQLEDEAKTEIKRNLHTFHMFFFVKKTLTKCKWRFITEQKHYFSVVIVHHSRCTQHKNKFSGNLKKKYA